MMTIAAGVLWVSLLNGFEPESVRVDVRLPTGVVCLVLDSSSGHHSSCWVRTTLSHQIESRTYGLWAGEWYLTVRVNGEMVGRRVLITVRQGIR